MSQRHRYPFTDPFLIALQEGIHRRARALSHSGKLSIEGGVVDHEWMELVMVLASDVAVILHGRAPNMIDIFIRSQRSYNRGRVLFRMEGLRVPNNASALVEAYEQTLSLAHVHDHAEMPRLQIQELWNGLSIHVA